MKARADSLWGRIPEDVRTELMERLLVQGGYSYEDAVKDLEEKHGIETSRTALCRMVQTHGIVWKYTASRETAAALLGVPGIKQALDDGRLSRETRDLLAARLATAAAGEMDVKEILAARGITLKEDELRLKARAQDLAEDKFKHVAAGDILSALRKDPEVLRALGEIAGDVRMTEVDKIAAIRARMWA